jgi:hypothetical protein
MATDKFSLLGADGAEVEALVERLAEEDLLGQLLRREGPIAELANEGGDLKLDWVDGVEKALAHPEWLAEVEAEAAAIVQLGIRHVIWSGMGGSVQAVYALKNMGYLDSPFMHIYPCDSTDPASLNRIVRDIAAKEGVPFVVSRPEREVKDRGVVGDGTIVPDYKQVTAALRQILPVTMMIGVSMGMTSEEPITHLEWFDGLLHEFDIPNPSDHIQVMTLPGSYLDQFARPRGSRMVPIQLDAENHTPGRMSAPATRVFLRPVALMLVAAARGGEGKKGGVRQVLERAQALYGVSHCLSAAERRELVRTHAFVRLGAYISHAVEHGRNKVCLVLPPEAQGFAPWLEQLVEESLGKGGKGVLIFYGETLRPPEEYGDDVIFLQVCVEGLPAPLGAHAAALREAGPPVLSLHVPLASLDAIPDGLGELAGVFAASKLTVAAFGFLQGIVYAGQPAVEAYKKYARDLREAPEPVPFPEDTPYQARFRSLTLYYNSLITKGLLSVDELAAALAGGEGRGGKGREGEGRETGEQEGSRVDTSGTSAPAVYAAILRCAQAGRSSIPAKLNSSEAQFQRSSIPAKLNGWFRYVDFTFNGEITAPFVVRHDSAVSLRSVFEEARRELVNGTLRLRGKIRTGPSDYHSTEQSETDGPPELISTRFVALTHEPILAGTYSDKFLLAQARGTWQAMEDANRWILMVTLPELNAETMEALRAFVKAVRERLEEER